MVLDNGPGTCSGRNFGYQLLVAARIAIAAYMSEAARLREGQFRVGINPWTNRQSSANLFGASLGQAGSTQVCHVALQINQVSIAENASHF
jgi:hypothetical protein